MKKALLSILILFFCNLLLAQDTPPNGPQLTEIKTATADTVKADTLKHTYEKGYANVYVFGPSSFNRGAVLAPQLYAPLNVLSTTYNYYSAYDKEKAGVGYAFGIEYETKEFAKRFYIGIGGEMQKYQYSGVVTEVTVYTGGTTKDSTAQKLAYSWSVTNVNIPVRIHIMAYQNEKFRFDVAFGASIGKLTQTNSADQSNQSDDAFNSTYMTGIIGIGAEYNFIREDLLRIEPCYYVGLEKSPGGRRLASFGIRLGFMFD
jgi:hypothetical protein